MHGWSYNQHTFSRDIRGTFKGHKDDILNYNSDTGKPNMRQCLTVTSFLWTVYVINNMKNFILVSNGILILNSWRVNLGVGYNINVQDIHDNLLLGSKLTSLCEY